MTRARMRALTSAVGCPELMLPPTPTQLPLETSRTAESGSRISATGSSFVLGVPGRFGIDQRSRRRAVDLAVAKPRQWIVANQDVAWELPADELLAGRLAQPRRVAVGPGPPYDD